MEGEDGVPGGCCGFVALFSFVVSVSMFVCVRAWTGRCEGGGRTWTRIRSAPASARAMATAWPMPRVPPVTTAVWPSRENRLGVAILANWSCSRLLRIFQGTNHRGTRVQVGRLSWWVVPTSPTVSPPPPPPFDPHTGLSTNHPLVPSGTSHIFRQSEVFPFPTVPGNRRDASPLGLAALGIGTLPPVPLLPLPSRRPGTPTLPEWDELDPTGTSACPIPSGCPVPD